MSLVENNFQREPINGDEKGKREVSVQQQDEDMGASQRGLDSKMYLGYARLC
jgi:hypothetical protein